MSIAHDLDRFIKDSGDDVFIEAEGKLSRLRSFYAEYNSSYCADIGSSTDGIIVLDEDANKWGLELRLYLHHDPSCLNVNATRNRTYRCEYAYRINDVDVIRNMFDLGYRIGLN